MATEEIQYLEDELQGIYTELRRGIEQLTAMQTAADKKMEKYAQLNSRISRARNAYQSFKVELRELRDEEKKTWSAVSACLPTIFTCPRLHQPFLIQLHSCFLLQKEKEHNQTITKLDSDLKMAKSNWERQDLLAGKESALASALLSLLYVSALLNPVSLCHRASRI